MFKSARNKITLMYLTIIMIITLFFSTIVYINVTSSAQSVLKRHQNRLDNRLKSLRQPIIEDELADFQNESYEQAMSQIKVKVLTMLAILNSIVFVISGVIAYWFSSKTLSPIQEMIENQKMFIQNASHDLKTPITAIKMQLELALKNKNMSKIQSNQLFFSLLEDTNSLNDLVSSLISQTKSQEFNKKLVYEVIDLKKFINTILKTLSPNIKSKEIKIIKDFSISKITTDKKILREILTILVDNAIKFNNDLGTITISTSVVNHKVNIAIKNTGVGILEEDLPYIFDRFYKSNKSRENDNGFGLGLSIAKQLSHQLKGSIKVNIEPNKETIFTLILPNK